MNSEIQFYNIYTLKKEEIIFSKKIQEESQKNQSKQRKFVKNALKAFLGGQTQSSFATSV
jgi:hypothetical protein